MAEASQKQQQDDAVAEDQANNAVVAIKTTVGTEEKEGEEGKQDNGGSELNYFDKNRLALFNKH